MFFAQLTAVASCGARAYPLAPSATTTPSFATRYTYPVALPLSICANTLVPLRLRNLHRIRVANGLSQAQILRARRLPFVDEAAPVEAHLEGMLAVRLSPDPDVQRTPFGLS